MPKSCPLLEALGAVTFTPCALKHAARWPLGCTECALVEDAAAPVIGVFDAGFAEPAGEGLDAALEVLAAVPVLGEGLLEVLPHAASAKLARRMVRMIVALLAMFTRSM
jgi:hypothetical protein